MTPSEALPASEAQYYIKLTRAPPKERTLVLKEDETFGLFDRFGDIDANLRLEEGVFHHGTRFLSALKLNFLGNRPLLLSSTIRRDNVLLAVDLTNPDVYEGERLILPRGALHIYRTYFIWRDALNMRIHTRNYALDRVEIAFSIDFGADFVDIFEVRGEKRERRGDLRPPRAGRGNGEATLEYQGLDGVLRRTAISSSPAARVRLPSSMDFGLRLQPGAEEAVEFTFRFELDHFEPNGAAAPASYGYVRGLQDATRAAEGENRIASSIATSNEQFDDWMERSRSDLNMLLTSKGDGVYPYAGVPWFSTPFGRDGIITALQCLWVAPFIARGVLSYLTATQAREVSPERDAEPGKILHEAREGEMAALREIPFGQYYGSVDATPLYLMLAGAYYRRTGDLEFLESIWPGLELALNWLDRFGDPDRDGFVEYQRQSPNGLVQQGWKDSQDSVFHADGKLAEGPIALCEVQAYAYAAKTGVAEIAAAMGNHDLAQRLAAQARTLQAEFERAFWSESIDNYVLALDGDKKQCSVRASNAGHCLFGGIADRARALTVATGLTSESFFSAWGVRTLAEGQPRYNPMSYHNGSVWPHDNSLIAAGFAKYRLTNLAARIMGGQFEASAWMELNRLPELFCGFARRPGKGPTSYPVACSPQAWASGAAFLLLQSSIGLSIDARNNRIVLARPFLPPFLEQLRIKQLVASQSSVDLVLFRSGNGVAVTVERREGDVDVIVLN